jgi:DNA polymerase III subunit beta
MMALNFSVHQKDFLEAINSMQNICNKKGTLAILANVLIDTVDNGILVTGTDLEVGLRIFVPAEVIGNGSITLPSKKLFEILRESGTNFLAVEELDNYWVNIKSGASTYNLAGIASEEFPEFPEYSNDGFVSIESFYFLELIEKCIFSIANEQENIYSLTSALMECEVLDSRFFLKMISSDGHRLSIISKEVLRDIGNLQLNDVTLIPKKGLMEFKRFCEQRDLIEVLFEEKQLVVKDNKSVMIIRLKSGEFPQYGAIVDAVELSNCLKIKRLPFLESLKRINIFTEDVFHTIQLRVENNLMILSSQNSELGNAKDELNVEYSGDPLTLGFNCRYFIESLQVMEGEVIEAFINSNSSPCLMRSDSDAGFISIIMPMQL